MKRMRFICLIVLIGSAIVAYASTPFPAHSHGIAYPHGWQKWASIGVSHRTDNNTIRVILGNETAVIAARTGKTNPWPDGAIIGKVVWKDVPMEVWQEATEPGQLVHAEFMLKDTKKYNETYGWGWARWVGQSQAAFNEGADVCISCHTPVKNRDWVFTTPAVFPSID